MSASAQMFLQVPSCEQTCCKGLDVLLHFQVPSFNNVTLLPSEQVTAQEIDRYFRLELIYKRNERMGRRVRALLEKHPDKSFFFAFGAGGLGCGTSLRASASLVWSQSHINMVVTMRWFHWDHLCFPQHPPPQLVQNWYP